MLDISSTFIRKAVSEGKDLRYFVPEPAWKIIASRELYKYPITR
jgi:nicotinate-nucleotide adenylyltransferase